VPIYDFDNTLVGGTAVILIDCCVPLGKQNPALHQELYSNIHQAIPLIPNLTAVILASYESTDGVDNAYAATSQQLFHDHQPFEHVKHLWTWSQDRWKGPSNTDPSILAAQWPCVQLAMTEHWQLDLYVNTVVPHVKNILLMGRYWSRCILSRPLGIQGLELMRVHGHLARDSKVLVLQDCVLDGELEYGTEFFPDLKENPCCELVTQGLFEVKSPT
jgi:hypothetical protein